MSSSFLDFIFSSEALAIVIPMVIFIVTVVLIVKRLASFLITIVLLAFALVSGFAIVHHDAVGDHFRGEISPERYQELQDSFADFRDQLLRAVQDLQQRIVEDKNETESFRGDTSKLLNGIDRQIEALETAISETREALKVSDTKETAREVDDDPREVAEVIW